jgi:hypothetical protein
MHVTDKDYATYSFSSTPETERELLQSLVDYLATLWIEHLQHRDWLTYVTVGRILQKVRHHVLLGHAVPPVSENVAAKITLFPRQQQCRCYRTYVCPVQQVTGMEVPLLQQTPSQAPAIQGMSFFFFFFFSGRALTPPPLQT